MCFNSNLEQGGSLLGNSIWCDIKFASFGCYFDILVLLIISFDRSAKLEMEANLSMFSPPDLGVF